MRSLYPAARDLATAADLEEQYLPHATRPAGAAGGGRHVRVDFVASLDGAVEVGRHSRPLSGPADRAVFFAMRAVADVVVVGAGTVRAEEYGPIRLDEDRRRRRAARGQSPLPALAIVSDRAELEPTARVFAGEERTLVLTTASAAAARPDLAGVAEVVVCGETRVDLRLALDELARRGLRRVLCEGGPALLGSLLAVDAVDELCLTLSPVLVGAPHLRLAGEEPLAGGPVRLRLTGVVEADGVLMTRYARVRGAP